MINISAVVGKWVTTVNMCEENGLYVSLHNYSNIEYIIFRFGLCIDIFNVVGKV